MLMITRIHFICNTSQSAKRQKNNIKHLKNRSKVSENSSVLLKINILDPFCKTLSSVRFREDVGIVDEAC